MTDMDRFMLMTCFGAVVGIAIVSWIEIICRCIEMWKGRKRK